MVRDTPQRPELTVAWYGGERRRVGVVTGTGWWYQSGRPLIPVCWVFVRDRTGTHRDEYFFTTDVTMSPKAVIETYTGRWNIETTFEEMRSYVGLETTRGWRRATVLRMTDPSDIWIRVYVPEASLAKLTVGSDAALRIDGIPEPVPAVVESIATRGEFTPANLQTPDERGKQVFGVRLRLKQPDPRVKAGMYATVKQLGQWS